MSSNERHWDSSPAYDWRLWSLLTTRLCCLCGSEVGHWFRSVTPHVQWHRQHLNVQKPLTAYSKPTRTWQFSHHQGLSFHQHQIGLSGQTLHTSTSGLSHLGINQLDFGCHTAIFRLGKCSITLSSCCTHAVTLVNGIYILKPPNCMLNIDYQEQKRQNELQLPSKSNNQQTYKQVFTATYNRTHKSSCSCYSKVKTMPATKRTHESYCHIVNSQGI
jgi:hypothetical protein